MASLRKKIFLAILLLVGFFSPFGISHAYADSCTVSGPASVPGGATFNVGITCEPSDVPFKLFWENQYNPSDPPLPDEVIICPESGILTRTLRAPSPVHQISRTVTLLEGIPPLFRCQWIILVGGGATPTPTVGPGYTIPRCGVDGVETAIGCVSTGFSGFAEFFLKWFLGIAGVIAFFLIIVAGFQILTSAGDPEKLQGAKQLLTAAIVGLLFVVFAVVILQVIGISILGGLPGFPRFP